MLLFQRTTCATSLKKIVKPSFPSGQLSRYVHATSAQSPKAYYVTTPIFYVNAEPHIGHLHSLVLADVLKRYRHLRYGEYEPKPVLLTGTDEHGMKIQKAAEAQHVSPLELCNRVSQRFEALARAANVDYDVFYRTTNVQHVEVVQEVWRRLKEKGYIYKASYEGWYSVSDEAYYTNSQIRDEEGPTGTIKVAIESSQPVEWTSEENYMFKLSLFRQPLLDWLKANPTVIQPAVRYNEVLSYLETEEMGDLSISRPRSRLQWGIEVPDDPSHTIYVWMDALINYLSYTGYPHGQTNIWPADTHVIGKDIIRFHAVYWPAILMALDLPLPRQILAHAHWTMDNFKMSKSRGNVVNPFEALKDFSVDGIRFFLMSKGGLSSDSNFAPEHVARDYRKFLAGQAGNMLQRLQSKAMLRKMESASAATTEHSNEMTPEESDLSQFIQKLPALFHSRMATSDISGAIDSVLDCLARINAYIAQKEPWKLEDPTELARVFSYTIEGLRKSSILLSPIIPTSSQELLAGLGHSSALTWTDAETDFTSEGMRKILESVKGRGPQAAVFRALKNTKDA